MASEFTDLTFEPTVERNAADIEAVEAGLLERNLRHGKIDESRDLFIDAREKSGTIAAGILGRTWGV